MSTTPDDPKRQSQAAYQGAKPGALTADDLAALGAADDDAHMAAMSALLARNWWAIALRGVFAILFGLIAVLMPVITIGALVLLFGAYMVVDGIFDLVAALRAARSGERWGLLVLEGIIDFAAGAIAFFWPLATVFAVIILMAAWAIVSGVALTGAAFRLHASHGRWLMALAGIVSVVWGVLLVLWPVVGAVVLTIWLGAYALFFGGALLVLAFQLRRRSAAGKPAMSPGV
jgi:uncharacterized membrane protein HdeD (DUF308 family)